MQLSRRQDFAPTGREATNVLRWFSNTAPLTPWLTEDLVGARTHRAELARLVAPAPDATGGADGLRAVAHRLAERLWEAYPTRDRAHFDALLAPGLVRRGRALLPGAL